MGQLPLTFNEEWLPSLFLSVVAAIKNPARGVIDWGGQYSKSSVCVRHRDLHPPVARPS
jgi:hypothetical protein